MAVSPEQRAYMDRIGVYKAASHLEASQRQRSASVTERLSRSWELFLNARSTANIEGREDDPSLFYALARKRGLYKAGK